METAEALARIRAAYDTGDILIWCREMAADERRVLAQHNMPDAPIPMQKVVEEIERLRAAIERQTNGRPA
jgi:hypothetical protein